MIVRSKLPVFTVGQVYCVDCGYLDDAPKAEQKSENEVVETDSDDELEDLEASLLLESLVKKSFAGPEPQRTKAATLNLKQTGTSADTNPLKATEDILLQVFCMLHC